MGSIIRPLLIAAPLLLAAPLHAQQTGAQTPGFQLPPASSAPPPNANQQGPELNVYRDPVTPRAAPPVVVPPAVVPTVTPPATTVQPTPQPSRPRPAPTPTESRETRPADRATPAPAPAPAPSTRAPVATTPAQTPAQQPAAPDAAANASTPVAPPPQPLPAPAAPAPAANGLANPEPAAAPATQDDGVLPWIIAGIIALIALAAAVLLRRRSANRLMQEAQLSAPVAQPRPTPQPAPAPAPEPTPAPAPADALHAPALPLTATADRPWLDMDMAVAQARYSMMGVTISYSLILHNRGDRPARDVLVRGMIGNGGAQQQAVLQGFFTGQDGLPMHSAVSIAPGETIQMSGELRLAPDQIVPVDMGQRSLLIPLAAFDAAYRWGAGDSDPSGQGRTARAFIVGQEQDPPADRLAPLRLDQGPRQYRRPAARAAAELTPA